MHLFMPISLIPPTSVVTIGFFIAIPSRTANDVPSLLAYILGISEKWSLCPSSTMWSPKCFSRYPLKMPSSTIRNLNLLHLCSLRNWTNSGRINTPFRRIDSAERECWCTNHRILMWAPHMGWIGLNWRSYVSLSICLFSLEANILGYPCQRLRLEGHQHRSRSWWP